MAGPYSLFNTITFFLSPQMYSWLPLFEELGRKLADFEQDQPQLVAYLTQADAQVAADQFATGTGPLVEMDPFTFFSLCTKYGSAKQLSIFSSLKSQLSLAAATPTDVSGVPNANALLAWFFKYAKNRKPHVVPLLWQLYHQVQAGAVDEAVFAQVLGLPGVGWGKLTQGIFDVQPQRYIPLNAQTRPYFERWGLDSQFPSYPAYMAAVAELVKLTGKKTYEISYEAYLENQPIPEKPITYYCAGCAWDTGDQLPRFREEGLWQNGHEAKFTDEVKQVPVGARLAAKSTFVHRGTGASTFRVKAYGTVTSNAGDGYQLGVAWDDAGPGLPFDLSGTSMGKYQGTLHKISKPAEIQAIFTPPLRPTPPADPMNVPYALNTILYGPPGTGKTYGTIEIAAHIATGKTPEELAQSSDKTTMHKAAKRVFDELRGDQIEFVTFHQNYAYEDFVLGIRPSLSGEKVGFQRQEGVFFKICQRATENYLARPTDTPATFYRPFQEVFTEFVQPLVEAEENGTSTTIPLQTAQGKTFHLTALNETNLSFINASGGDKHTLALKTIEAAYNVREYHGIGLSSYYKPLNYKLMELGRAQRPTEPLKNYVLVIDEINRANISRVFGELITLLEDDKRLGGDNALTVRLPGGEEFAVPPNLYVLGTMNTADKSIALVDVALRRRFEFLGRYPDYQLLDAAVRPVVQKLNDQIYEAKKSADFFIGHAYFLGKTMAELPDVLNKKVVPLLLEYFSGRTDFVEKQLTAALASTGLLVKRNAAYQLEVSAA